MNVEIGAEAPIFLFWEYLFRNCGILSLQCSSMDENVEWSLGGNGGMVVVPCDVFNSVYTFPRIGN
jgi:hypothetical protein